MPKSRQYGTSNSIPPSIASEQATMQASQPSHQILLVDDNPLSQKLTAIQLEMLGYQVGIARSGHEALRLLSVGLYNVVFMDVQMPDIDGLETTRRIRRELPRSSQPWVVAMTAADLPGDREKCIQAGMDDYLAKPILRNGLLLALERARALNRLTPAMESVRSGD